MKTTATAATVQVASAKMPTRYGDSSVAFKRDVVNGTATNETALALVLAT